MKKRLVTPVVLLVVLAAALLYGFRERIFPGLLRVVPPILTVDQGVSVDDLDELPDEGASTQPIERLSVAAEGLDVPWEIAFLPDGAMLVTERGGILRKIGEGGWMIQVPVAEGTAEGGLLGLAVHPRFDDNRFIYLYVTVNEGGAVRNRVDRYRLEGDRIEGRTTIIQNIPGATYHDGGRIAFGPDRKLYVTTGDAGEAFLAQDTSSLAGKILRLNDDGTVPGDNPFSNAVWSYGHRNPQGLAWDRRGRLWATEHGRSGVRSGLDELNLIEKGRNYGWPTIQGDAEREGMETPVLHSGAVTTWAPAGMAAVGDQLFFAGLRGESLYQAAFETETSAPKLVAHFFREFGRLRAVVRGPDGFLYVSTSNRDGRGTPKEGDDKILKIDPRLFE